MHLMGGSTGNVTGHEGRQRSQVPTRHKNPIHLSGGFPLQNKLIDKTRKNARNGSVGTFQSLLYKLSQPQHELTSCDQFLLEDVFCSPKFRDAEGKTMQVRYDRNQVVSRSICGTKGSFEQYLNLKA